MKKIVLTAMAFVAMLGANAQNTITPVEGIGGSSSFWVIPRIFTNNTYIYSQNKDPETNERSDTVNIINSNLQVEKTFVLNLGEDGRGRTMHHPLNIELFNYDAEIMYDDVDFYYSQTLFNNDNNFEFLKPIHVSNSWSNYYTIERIDILSDDGTVVNTITWDNGFLAMDEAGVSLYKIGNIIYFSVLISNGEIHKSAWYRLDRQTQSISRVENVPFNVFPTVAERGREIIVQLGEGTNAHEIVVVDAMGREVKSVPVVQGQREVKINTSNLSTGMVFVSDRKNGAVKIIVR